jgi:GNAT superfamily N-acetyltransferase
MLRIFEADTDEHRCCVRKLLGEYLEGVHASLSSQLNVNRDHKASLERNMAGLGRFSPPHGRLLLAEYDGQMAGMVCLQRIEADVGKVDHVYVRPELRRRGIARALLEQLIEEARQIGYDRVRLDTARVWLAARSLYASVGFHEIDRYPGTGVPEEFESMAVYMERTLR